VYRKRLLLAATAWLALGAAAAYAPAQPLPPRPAEQRPPEASFPEADQAKPNPAETNPAENNADPPAAAVEQYEKLLAQVAAARADKNYQAAIRDAKQVLAMERKWLQEDDPEVVRSIEWLAELHEEAEDWPAARKWRENVLAWRRKHRGEQHWQTTDARIAIRNLTEFRAFTAEQQQQLYEAWDLDEQVAQLIDQEDYQQALPLAQRSLEIKQGVVDKQHRWCGDSLGDLTIICRAEEEYPRAESLCEQTLRIVEKSLGKQHPDYATALAQLADLCLVRGDGDRAEALYRQALPIIQQSLGEDHIDHAGMLNDFGVVLDTNEHYEQAEATYRQALAIYQRQEGEPLIGQATTLENLGMLYASQDDNDQAIELFKQALAIQRSYYAGQPEDICYCLRDLAAFYESIDQHSDAVPLYREALEIDQRTSGEQTAEYADHLNQLAELHRHMQSYDEALRLHQQSLQLREKLLGKEHLDYTTSLNNLALTYAEKGEFALVEPLYLEALETRKKLFGDSHEYVVLVSNNLAQFYSDRGAYAKAGPLFQEVAEFRRLTLGAEHSDYASSLNLLALNYYRLAKYERAEQLYKQALEIKKQALGEQNPDVGLYINNLALVYSVTGEFAKSEQLYKQSLAISRAALGERHPRCALTLINLGNLYATEARYADAEQLYNLAIEIRREAFGEQHLNYAHGLDCMIDLLLAKGAYAQAETLCRQSLAIKQKTVGGEHPSYAASLSDLSRTFSRRGNYAKAEQYCRQALEVRGAALGQMHPVYADSLNDLAMHYVRTGDYAKAQPLYRQALETRLRVYGNASPIVAVSWANLGHLYQQTKDYPRAEQAYLQGLRVILDSFDQNHPAYATMLNNLACLYFSMPGKLAEGGARCREVLIIRKQVLGEDHHDYATGLKNLAYYHMLRGEYDQARQLNTQALDIWLRTLGEKHTSTATAQSDLGYLGLLQGDIKLAARHLGVASRVRLENLRETFSVQTERQKLIMLNKSRAYLDTWLTVAADAGAPPAEVYDRLLLWKGIVFTDQQRQRLMQRDSKLDAQFKKLRDVTRRLAAVGLAIPKSDEKRQARAKQLDALTSQKERLERDLALQSHEFRTQQQAERVTSQELTASLPADSVLVDFLVYDRTMKPRAGSHKVWTQQHLLAFVCLPSGDVKQVDLGQLDPIEKLVKKWRRQTRYPVATLGDRHPGIALKQLVWSPLERYLADAKIVLLSPDGPLCRLAFAALPGESPDTFLIEQQAIAVVPVPQLLPQLLNATAPADPSAAEAGETLLLVGDVNYGGNPGATSADLRAEEAADRAATLALAPAALERSAEQRGTSLPTYGHLEGTRAEIDQLGQTFESRFPGQSVTVLDRNKATESALRTHAPRCSWLHMATHGFFAPSRLRTMLAPPDIKPEDRTSLLDSGGVVAFHPGLLSGIVLTGANSEPGENQDDGILTALEVSALDLRQIELAVLSACETGLGEESGGEGLLGLQRAFQSAGARTVVSSLWRVPDEQTSMLMQRFYSNVWLKKMSKIQALRDAQLSILNNSEVSRDDVPPAHWAAFTLSGDWR